MEIECINLRSYRVEEKTVSEFQLIKQKTEKHLESQGLIELSLLAIIKLFKLFRTFE